MIKNIISYSQYLLQQTLIFNKVFLYRLSHVAVKYLLIFTILSNCAISLATDNYALSDLTTIKQNSLPIIINNLTKMEGVYNNYIKNNSGLPVEVNVSMQITALSLISELNKYKQDAVTFENVKDIEFILDNIIQQEDATRIFITTSNGCKCLIHEVSSENEGINAITSYANNNLDNWIPFTLSCYNKSTEETIDIVSKNLVTTDNDIATAKQKVADFIAKYNNEKNYKLTLSYPEIIIKENYFNHKKSTVPHSIAVYLRMKNNFLTIVAIEPAVNLSEDYNGIVIGDMIEAVARKVIQDKIPYNIYNIALGVQEYGADCMMHAYEVSKEIVNHSSFLDSFCTIVQNNNNIKDNYKYLLHNIPIAFFKTMNHLDSLDNIIENQNDNRKAEIQEVKNNLQAYHKDRFAFLSMSVSQIGIYNSKSHTDLFEEKHKIIYPESKISTYLGYYKNVNTFLVTSLLELIKNIKNDLTNDDITKNLTQESVTRMLNSIQDITEINETSLQKILKHIIAMQDTCQDSEEYYYIFEIKNSIKSIIEAYDEIITKLSKYVNKDEIEIHLDNIYPPGEYIKIYAKLINFNYYIQQLNKYKKNNLSEYIQILEENLKNNDFTLNEKDKHKIIESVKAMQQGLNNILIDINYKLEKVCNNSKTLDKNTFLQEMQNKDLTAFLEYNNEFFGCNYRRNIVKHYVDILQQEIWQDSHSFIQYIMKTKQKNRHNKFIKSLF